MSMVHVHLTSPYTQYEYDPQNKLYFASAGIFVIRDCFLKNKSIATEY